MVVLILMMLAWDSRDNNDTICHYGRVSGVAKVTKGQGVVTKEKDLIYKVDQRLNQIGYYLSEKNYLTVKFVWILTEAKLTTTYIGTGKQLANQKHK